MGGKGVPDDAPEGDEAQEAVESAKDEVSDLPVGGKGRDGLENGEQEPEPAPTA
jgi:hypothetical protein